MSLTKEAVDRIASLGAAAEKERIVTLPNGSVILLTSECDEDGCDHTCKELIPPTKDARGAWLEPQSHLQGSVTLQTADSLVDYTNRFAVPGALLFADFKTDTIAAVLNYHPDGVTPAHADHKAVLKLPRSEEWSLWAGISGSWMTQLDFARFLRENAAEIKAPDAATLLETVQDISAVRNVNFTKAVRLNSENESFEYTDETKANSKGALTIPERFVLQMPVYFGGRTVEIGAFLRWKLDGQQLYLGIQLQRAEHVRQAVFQEVVSDVSERTTIEAVYGPVA